MISFDPIDYANPEHFNKGFVRQTDPFYLTTFIFVYAIVFLASIYEAVLLIHRRPDQAEWKRVLPRPLLVALGAAFRLALFVSIRSLAPIPLALCSWLDLTAFNLLVTTFSLIIFELVRADSKQIVGHHDRCSVTCAGGFLFVLNIALHAMAVVVSLFPMVAPVRLAFEICLYVAFNATAFLYAGYGYRISQSLKVNAKNTNLYRRDSMSSRPLRPNPSLRLSRRVSDIEHHSTYEIRKALADCGLDQSGTRRMVVRRLAKTLGILRKRSPKIHLTILRNTIAVAFVMFTIVVSLVLSRAFDFSDHRTNADDVTCSEIYCWAAEFFWRVAEVALYATILNMHSQNRSRKKPQMELEMANLESSIHQRYRSRVGGADYFSSFADSNSAANANGSYPSYTIVPAGGSEEDSSPRGQLSESHFNRSSPKVFGSSSRRTRYQFSSQSQLMTSQVQVQTPTAGRNSRARPTSAAVAASAGWDAHGRSSIPEHGRIRHSAVAASSGWDPRGRSSVPEHGRIRHSGAYTVSALSQKFLYHSGKMSSSAASSSTASSSTASSSTASSSDDRLSPTLSRGGGGGGDTLRVVQQAPISSSFASASAASSSGARVRQSAHSRSPRGLNLERERTRLTRSYVDQAHSDYDDDAANASDGGRSDTERTRVEELDIGGDGDGDDAEQRLEVVLPGRENTFQLTVMSDTPPTHPERLRSTSGSERPPVTANTAGSPSAHSPYPRTNSTSVSAPYPRARSRTPTAVANRQNSRSASGHPPVPVPPMPSEYSRQQSPNDREEADRGGGGPVPSMPAEYSRQQSDEKEVDQKDLAREQTLSQRVSADQKDLAREQTVSQRVSADRSNLAREQTLSQKVSAGDKTKKRGSILMADYVVKKLGKSVDQGVSV